MDGWLMDDGWRILDGQVLSADPWRSTPGGIFPTEQGAGGVEVHMESFPSQALRWRVGVSHQLSKLHSAQAILRGGSSSNSVKIGSPREQYEQWRESDDEPVHGIGHLFCRQTFRNLRDTKYMFIQVYSTGFGITDISWLNHRSISSWVITFCHHCEFVSLCTIWRLIFLWRVYYMYLS